MRRNLVAALVLLLSVNVCTISTSSQQDSTTRTFDQEIRSALCDIDSGDFATAEKKLEKVLQSDFGNIYAQRLLLGILTRQVKLGDNSPENIALARKAIEASQRALNNPQFSSKEKAGIDRHILVLYGQISQEEQTNELLRLVSDSNRTPIERADIYTVLASRSWNCSYEITSSPDNKVSAVKNKRVVFSYRMPKDPKDYQAARMCFARGMKEIENALILDPNNESAWSFKVNLLLEAAKLSEMENKLKRRVLYQKQVDEAQRRHEAVVAFMQKVRNEKWKKESEELKSQAALRRQSTCIQPDEQDQLSRELTEYKTENSLDKAMEDFSYTDDLSTLVAPVTFAPEPIAPESGYTTKERDPIPQAPPKGCFREVDGQAQVLEKRDWKIFSPAGEDFTVELPDSLCSSGGGYIAASDGVMYSISVVDRPSVTVDPTVVDGVLNTLARSFVGFRSRTWVSGANSFEVKLLRKEVVNDRPSKVYAYALVSCSKRKDGVLIVYAGKTHYYTVDISGANESDQRVQRFLKSVVFK